MRFERLIPVEVGDLVFQWLQATILGCTLNAEKLIKGTHSRGRVLSTHDDSCHFAINAIPQRKASCE